MLILILPSGFHPELTCANWQATKATRWTGNPATGSTSKPHTTKRERPRGRKGESPLFHGGSMKKNIALMALTGILTLASCSQGPTGTDTDKPTLTFTASPATNVDGGATVTLSGTVSDASGVKSVVITSTDGPVCTPTVANGAFSCTVTMPKPSADTTYHYTATATDNAPAANTTTASATVQVKGSNGGGGTTPTGEYNVTVKLVGAASTDVSVADANGFVLKTVPVVDGTKIPLKPGTYTLTGKAISGFTTTPKTVVVTTADTGVTLTYTAVVAPQPDAVTLGGDQQITPNMYNTCTTQPMLNGWMSKTDTGNVSSPIPTQTNFFVRGTVRVNLNSSAAGDKVEAYYQSTQPNSAVQKLDVITDSTGTYVLFDSTFGNALDNSALSHEGIPVTLTFRVNNVDVNDVTLIPDNLAPEAINPQVGAVRSQEAGGQQWAAGVINIFATNTAIQDKPVVPSSAVLNSGFEHVCYYMVPADSGIVDYNGDNPKGLADFATSIRAAAAYTSPKPITSAGMNSNGGTRYFGDTPFTTAAATPDGNGFIPGAKNIADGKYKVYALVADKLGNERPSGTPYIINIDNTAPKLDGIKAGFVDDSPLPFPAKAGYVSDYAKFTVTGNKATIDNSVDIKNRPISGIGVDIATSICTINGIDLINTASGTRFDTNKWPNGLNEKICGVKDLLGNYDPKNTLNVKVVVDNVDPVVNITAPFDGQVITAGATYNNQAAITDTHSPIRTNYMFWSPVYAGETPTTYKTASNSGAFNNPVEIARTAAGVNSISSIGWIAPSFADQAATPVGIKISVMAIDEAGNATLRSRTFAYTAGSSDGLPVFGNTPANFSGDVYNATSLTSTVGNNFSKNAINTTPIVITGDATLDANASQLAPIAGGGNVGSLLAYGRFNAVNWDDIRNYMLSSATNNTTATGDLTAIAPVGGALVPGAKTGDPSYLTSGTSNATSSDQRVEWNNFSAPWMTLQGVTNTKDTNGRFKLTNQLYNTMRYGTVNGMVQDAASYPASDPNWTYANYFTPWYDQMNAIAQVTDGNGKFIYFGRSVTK